MKYGHIADEPDHRDKFHPEPDSVSKLPLIVDLRSKMPVIFDQGQLGSCTANAIVALREYMSPTPILSRLFLYYQERKIEGTIGTDSGAQIRDGMKALQSIGVCEETDEPYNIAKFRQAPSPKAIEDAQKYKIASYARIPSLASLKLSLTTEKPVVIGFDVYESFESAEVAKTGIMPLPKKGEKLLGGHAVLVVGYDDSKEEMIVRNSWGPGWGQAGYFMMPYKAYSKYVSDAWNAA